MHSALIRNRQSVAWYITTNHGSRAVGNPLTTWAVSASSVVRNFSTGFGGTGLPPRWSAERLVPQKRRAFYICCSLVVRCWIVTVNTPALILGTFRESKYKSLKVTSDIQFFQFRLQLPSRNVDEVCPVWFVRIPLREILRMFVTRNIGIVNYCN